MINCILLSPLVQMALDYWYIAVALLLIAVLLIIIAVTILKRVFLQLKEDAQVNKARKQENEVRQRKEADRLKEAAITSFEEKENLEEELEEEIPPVEEIVEATEYMPDENVEILEKREIKAVYRVIYDKDNKEWMVKKDGAQRVIRRVKTKAEALELATQFAENQDLSLSVQKKDGKFQKKSNYSKMISVDKKEEEQGE